MGETKLNTDGKGTCKINKQENKLGNENGMS